MQDRALCILVLVVCVSAVSAAADSRRDLKTWWLKKNLRWGHDKHDRENDEDRACRQGGWGRWRGRKSCGPCPVGSFSAEGSSDCNQCPNGHTTRREGCKTIVECIPDCHGNKEYRDGQCVCPDGWVPEGDSCRRNCHGNKEYRDGQCVCPDGWVPEGDSCRRNCHGNKEYRDGQCVCPDGWVPEGDSCRQNCPGNKVYIDGKCVCPDGWVPEGDTCKSVQGGSDDPIMIGFNNHRFEFQGAGGRVYNILSEQDMQLNAQLIDVAAITGNKKSSTFFGTIAFQYHSDRVLVRPEFGSRIEVLVNGVTLVLSDMTSSMQASLPDGTHVKLWSRKQHVPDTVMVATPKLSLVIHGTGHHLNFMVSHLAGGLCEMHGVLGQTYNGQQQDVYSTPSGAFALEGADADYEVSALFALDSKFNRFGLQPTHCYESAREMDTQAGSTEAATEPTTEAAADSAAAPAGVIEVASTATEAARNVERREIEGKEAEIRMQVAIARARKLLSIS